MSTPQAVEPGFAAALLDPARAAPGVVSGGNRFSVYRNNVVVGLVEALADTYPAVRALVGDDFFRAASRDFVRACPPRSPVLIDYGGAFPGWIASFPPAAGVPYLGDVARLEWAWSRAFNAADAVPLDAGALAAVPPDSLPGIRLKLHPAAMVVVSRHPIVSLWAEATGREARSRIELGRAETALVARPRDTVEVRRVDMGAALFITGLGRGLPLGEAAGRAAVGADFDLASGIAELFSKSLVCGLGWPAEATTAGART